MPVVVNSVMMGIEPMVMDVIKTAKMKLRHQVLQRLQGRNRQKKIRSLQLLQIMVVPHRMMKMTPAR
jgi:hypothetical protein